MLRLLALVLALIGLATLLPAAANVSALPSGAPEKDCLGQLHSALIRTESSMSTRDPVTGALVVLDQTSSPGDFRGAAGVSELLALFEGLALRGCQIPIFQPGDCIDFSSENPCYPGDTDSDSYLDYLELRLGSDPNNPSSTPEYALRDEQAGSNTCSDHADNDLDGRRDNGDAGCRLTCDDFGGKDRCSDSDHDGWLKYVEGMWGSDPDDASSTPENVGDCIDFDSGLVCGPF